MEKQALITLDIDALVALVTERVLAELQPTTTKVAYTPQTLAAELNVTPRTIRAAITRGDLRAVKRAGKWIIPASAVSDWTTDAPTEAPRRRSKPMRPRKPATTLRETLRNLE